MEQNEILALSNTVNDVYFEHITQSARAETRRPFIVANTIVSSLQEIKQKHILPVFVKDNEPLISQAEFIEAAEDVARAFFDGEVVEIPQVRLSHPIKGRIPDAKDKPAAQLTDAEKTIYYERMMFIIEVPSISDTIDGNRLSLTIGGIKAYSQDNLYSKICDQHFKVFVGFKNQVCSNLCVWTDGYMDDLKVRHVGQLKGAILSLVERYNQNFHLFHLKQLVNQSITEHQFAQIIGKCKMYNHLPAFLKQEINPIHLGDQQISTVVKDFYQDQSFCRDEKGEINLWRLYNLFTNATKSSYIDQYIGRNVNAFDFMETLRRAIDNRQPNWFLN